MWFIRYGAGKYLILFETHDGFKFIYLENPRIVLSLTVKINIIKLSLLKELEISFFIFSIFLRNQVYLLLLRDFEYFLVWAA